jgi:hypothetical protein
VYRDSDKAGDCLNKLLDIALSDGFDHIKSWQDFGGYAAQKMMRPSALGSVPIYLSGKEKYYEARI